MLQYSPDPKQKAQLDGHAFCCFYVPVPNKNCPNENQDGALTADGHWLKKG